MPRMADDDRAPVERDLHVSMTPAAWEALRPALLRARAAELGEVRRRDVRLTAGYGDDTTREVMDDEARRAQARHDALDALLRALDVRE